MWRQFGPAFRITLFFTILTGLIYPGVVTALCQALFRSQANGSLVELNGRMVGSSLIGQNFTKPEYFEPRPSAAGNDGYDASASNASNYGPTNQKLVGLSVKRTAASRAGLLSFVRNTSGMSARAISLSRT